MRRLSLFLDGIRSLSLRQRVVLIGILVGVTVGASAFLFEHLIDFFFRESAKAAALLAWPWRALPVLLFPAAGAVGAGVLAAAFSSETRGHGSAEVKKALEERGGVISGRVPWVKFLASALTIGSGGSAGREGPIIQIGAGVGSQLGQWIGVPREELKALVSAGAAGGLAAAFSAPLAGVFFIMEALLKNFANEAFPAVVIAAVAGSVTESLLSKGNSSWPLLRYGWSGAGDFLALSAVGLVGAFLGRLYMRTLSETESLFERLRRLPPWLVPGLGGLLVGAISLWLPEIRGTGQAAIESTLAGANGGWRLPAGALVKILATSLTLGSGGSGGTLMPAMFIGTMGGASWGLLLAHFGLGAAQLGAFALAGLSCVITAAYDAPITGIVFALEISRDYAILPPIMCACIITYLATRAQAPVKPQVTPG